MLNLPKDAQRGLRKLSEDIHNLLRKNRNNSEENDHIIEEDFRSEEVRKENGAMFVNNNYYQPQPAVLKDNYKKSSFSRILKVTFSVVFLLFFIYAIYMLIVNPEIFIDKIESIAQSIVRFLRNVFT